MMMVYLTHITGSTVLCVCQHHFELLHTSSTVYHLFSFSMFLQMSLTNMHICFIAFSFVSLLLFGSTLSICLIFSLSVVSLKLLTWRVYLSTNRFLTFAISGLLQFSKTCCTFSLVLVYMRCRIWTQCYSLLGGVALDVQCAVAVAVARSLTLTLVRSAGGLWQRGYLSAQGETLRPDGREDPLLDCPQPHITTNVNLNRFNTCGNPTGRTCSCVSVVWGTPTHPPARPRLAAGLYSRVTPTTDRAASDAGDTAPHDRGIMDALRDKGKWFSELSELWPGQCMSLEVEEILVHEKSNFQDIMVIKT